MSVTKEIQDALDLLVKRYPNKKHTLVSEFPGWKHEGTIFCKPGDILKREGSDNRFTVVIDRQRREYMIVNLTLGYTFQGRLSIFHKSNEVPITLGQFNELLSGVRNNFTNTVDY